MVTIREDLKRRDFTMNAMAVTGEWFTSKQAKKLRKRILYAHKQK